MKKFIVLFSMMFFIMGSAFAQKGIQTAGVHLSYGTEMALNTNTTLQIIFVWNLP